MRSIGLDIHRDFAEVAIAEDGEVRSGGRIEMTPEALELFAQSLGQDDQVALEVSGNAWEVARTLRPHVERVVVVSPADTGIRAARAKTDRLDARALAKLLAAGQLDGVWVPDERTRAMRRRLGRRAQLVRVRTKAPEARQTAFDSAREGFLSRLNDVLVLAALLAFAGAVLALALVREHQIERQPTEHEGEQEVIATEVAT
jgi:transposase